MRTKAKLTPEEETYLIDAIKIRESEILEKLTSEIIICIESINFNYCNFQIEGLKFATLEFLEELFNLKHMNVSVKFENTRYQFVYNNIE